MTIHQFLRGEITNPKGLFVEHFWAFSDDDLENTHDFIQWVFPLNEPSIAVPSSPVLTETEAQEIREDSYVTIMLVKAASLYCDFLRRNRHWICAYNHNHLRITRVIKSLRLLVGDGAADRFKSDVLALVGDELPKIGSKAIDFWNAA